jgi:hypothetical protein
VHASTLDGDFDFRLRRRFEPRWQDWTPIPSCGEPGEHFLKDKKQLLVSSSRTTLKVDKRTWKVELRDNEELLALDPKAPHGVRITLVMRSEEGRLSGELTYWQLDKKGTRMCADAISYNITRRR